ncbi:membrane protein YdbS with pleckstrin-like domain [Enterobacter sp. Sphag1F]|nr:membrane protein YdbS with pleckstrin-like domain [Enterobacter sp. Sphag1F]NYI15898.1 membrane protein YdbS with pleckstrin-like domain [Enterobacter sp. Sphag71]
MMRFLKRWLVEQLKFLLCIYVPVLCALVFGVLKVYFYPESGMMSVGIVYLLTLMISVYKFR